MLTPLLTASGIMLVMLIAAIAHVIGDLSAEQQKLRASVTEHQRRIAELKERVAVLEDDAGLSSSVTTWRKGGGG